MASLRSSRRKRSSLGGKRLGLCQDPISESWVKLSFCYHFYGHVKKFLKLLLKSDEIEQDPARTPGPAKTLEEVG